MCFHRYAADHYFPYAGPDYPQLGCLRNPRWVGLMTVGQNFNELNLRLLKMIAGHYGTTE